ncbi:N-acetyltransferase, partial [Mesorhizobium sp. M7A.F.Ca.CA.004.01.1.1]|uniref:GNAT family N-acetyltransferase n=1 Tax=Mesorhizobium sp. M7A.F.Ca.CA.004.01.1.1 TaxID=2496689 RepID=UPI000FD37742
MNAPLPSSQRSERLLLRRPAEADLDFLIDLFSRGELVAHRPDPVPDRAQQSAARLRRDIGHWDKHGFGRWAVEADGKLIGFGGVTVSADFDGLNPS